VANLLQNLQALGRTKLMMLTGAGAGVLLLVAMLALGSAGPPLGTLYAGLDDAEAGRILTQLQAMKVDYRVSETGGGILVPADQVARTRMLLAQQGLPSNGGQGYELFDDQGALGLTSFMQKLNKARALEGELARTIQTLAGVKSARVHLSLPDAAAFRRDANPPSASVVVHSQGGLGLDRAQALAVRHLVAAAVPGLRAGAVTVMDATGLVLAAEGEGTDGLALLKAEEMRASTEQRLAAAIEQMLVPRFGPGNVRVRVAAELDLGRETLREQLFDPDSRVIRSTQSVEERERSSEGDIDRPTTVEQNLPLEDVTQQSLARGSEMERAEETVNYEISSKLRERAQEAGAIQRLAVAVVVNGSYTTDAAGAQIYQPRTAEELQRIENLVRTAIAFDAARGDMVTVENLEFLRTPADPVPVGVAVAAPAWAAPEVMRLLQWLMVAVVAALVILLVLRPLLQRRAEPGPAAPPAADAAGPALADQSDPVAGQLTHESTAMAAGRDTSLEDELDELIELKSVDGGVSLAALQRLAGVVDEHPEESITVLRTWIYEGTH